MYKNTNLYFTENIKVDVLFTRFKEPDMSKLLEPLIHKNNINIYIYNKGDDIPLGIPDDMTNIKIINIPNLGWDSYAYFYHIINNYDSLPDYIVNLHASAQNIDHKYDIYLNIITVIFSVFEGSSIKFFGGNHIRDDSYSFRINNWDASLDVNKTINKLTESKIYPFGAWLESKINKKVNDIIKTTWKGMFIVHRSRILKFPKSFYDDIFNEIQVWQSEVNHYIERSWYTFYNEE
jgi:hypothetical protein